MPILEWKRLRWYSDGDEEAFFRWLESIGGVKRIEGRGRRLYIHLRSRRLSQTALREFRGIYQRYRGNLKDLDQFLRGD